MECFIHFFAIHSFIALDSSPVPVTLGHPPPLLTCRVKYEAVVKNSVEQEVVGGDAKLPTVVVVAAVRSDYGVELHLKANPDSERSLSQNGSKVAVTLPSWSEQGRRT